MAHGPCLYEKTFICQRLSYLFSYHFTMRPKVQLTPFDVDYLMRRMSQTRARLDELKKSKVIPREKPPANFSFKPATFDLPLLIPFVSKDSHLAFGKFIGRNPFDLRIKPSMLSSPPSSSFFSSSNLFLVENSYVVGEGAAATRTDAATIS